MPQLPNGFFKHLNPKPIRKVERLNFICIVFWFFLFIFSSNETCKRISFWVSVLLKLGRGLIFLKIVCSSLVLVVAPFQHACCDLLSTLLVLFLCLWNSIVGTFGLVPPLYYWFLLSDTWNYSSPHTFPYVFALNKSWVQLTFRFSE